MSKITFAGLAAIFALILGMGALGTQQAAAEVTGVSVVGCELVAGGIDGDPDDSTDAGEYAICGVPLTADQIAGLDEAYGDGDGSLEPGELDDRDVLDNENSIGEDCTAPGFQCTLLVFVFVDDEGPVTIDPPSGLVTAQGGSIDFVCDTDDDDDTDEASLGTDNDCADGSVEQGGVANNGDGVVVFHVYNETADAGDVETVNVEQEDVSDSADVTVTATSDDVEISLTKVVIQDAGSTSDVSDCLAETDARDVTDVPYATLAIVQVVDSDGEPLARHSADVTSDDADIASAVYDESDDGIIGNTGQTVLDEDSGAVAQFVVVCGGDETGDTAITAELLDHDLDSLDESASADLTVVGEADSVALTASPASIACDGTATSTVSATVTDADGNNVADGTTVNFSVVALGTANPINTTTTDGVATSTITPLSNASAGVTVIVTSGEAQASIRVDCSLPIPPQPPVPTPTRPGGIVGPDTGNGGYLGQDGSAGFPAWTLVALALGSIALVGGGLVTKKVSK